MKENVEFVLNGENIRVTTDSERMLLWVLRTDLGLTGTKYGCGENFCGACTVLVDNRSVRSCSTELKKVNGKEVVTIEGLERTGVLHPLQSAFIRHDALQCGYCTPGMMMNAVSLLTENPHPTEAQIIEGMEDNLCRCGAHPRILKAIQSAASEIRGGK